MAPFRSPFRGLFTSPSLHHCYTSASTNNDTGAPQESGIHGLIRPLVNQTDISDFGILGAG